MKKDPNEFFSVSEFNSLVHDVISSGFPRSIWVCGELQGFDRNKDRKHIFFDLVEKDPETNEIKAKIGLVIWGTVKPKIDTILKKSENAFDLKDDIEVKFLCKVDFYSPQGALRLVVETIDPVHTLGKIAQERQKLIAELTQSGVLQRNKELSLSPVPLNIGLITAFDSAAHNDFRDELSKSGYSFKIFLFRALMQGKGCPDSVCQGLKALNKMEHLDAIIITRGGGSIAELSCFDSKPIAEAIAASRYPVLTGIGHEINTSITDLAAHTFEKTPTAIAQFLAQRITVFMDAMAENYLHIITMANDKVREHRDALRQMAFELQAGTTALIKDNRERHIQLEDSLKKSPVRNLARSRQGIDLNDERLKKTIHLRFDSSLTKIGHCQKMITLASPQNTLKRGFSITRTKSGTLVRNANDLKLHDSVVTELVTGKIESIVEHIYKEK